MATDAYKGSSPGALLCLVLMIVGFWGLTGLEAQRQWQPRDQIRLTIGERYFRVSGAEVEALRADSEFWFREQGYLGQAMLQQRVDNHLDRLFLRVRNRIPAFLDWYYSLKGDYSRLGMAALSAVGVVDDDYIHAKASAMLFEPVGWEQSLAGLDRGLTSTLLQHARRARQGWLERVMSRLSQYEVPAPIQGHEHSARAAGASLSLDALSRSLEADALMTLNERAFASVGGGTLAGFAVWRSALRGAAALGARSAATRGAGRAATRIGSGAAGGAVVCSPGGPAALGCALVAGAATMLTMDWALINIEEAVGRERLRKRLEAGLADFRRELERDLRQRTDARVSALEQARRERIRTLFLPLEHISGGSQGTGWRWL